MAKSTRYGGDSYTDHEMQDQAYAILRNRPTLGGERKSAGINSSQSSGSSKTKSGDESQSLQQPAPETENPSSKDTQDNSSARSTGTGGRKTRAKQSGKPNVRSTDEIDDEEFE